MIRKVSESVETLKNELIELSEYIWHNPELGSREFKACAAHIKLLEKHGFQIEKEYVGLETAFKAVFDSGVPGPNIAFLAEYDALPTIGHGCGHNLLGATSTGAGIVLSKMIKNLKGKVTVFGTPAEETNGAKVEMAEKGAFDDVDVAMEAHPADKYYKSSPSLAMEALQFTFKGKSAHASVSPEKGVNALDAAINTFVNINALRQQILPTARVHGIIAEGGKAANIIPDMAIAQFYVRATKKTYLQELVEKVKNCARGASLAAGTQLEIVNYETSFDNLLTNETLSEVFCKRLKDVGVEQTLGARDSMGSLDAGNVSHVVPTIHPWFCISEDDITSHTKEFAEAAKSSLAYDGMTKTISALVLTALDVITEDGLLERIKEEFISVER